MYTFIYYIYSFQILADIILQVKDDKDVHMHGHITIGEEAGKSISQGLSTIGSNIGLGATVAGVASAVAKGISKSSIPPVQKAGIIMSAGIVGGAIHTLGSSINRNNSLNSESINLGSSETGSSISILSNNNKGNNFIDINTDYTPIEILLQCINIITHISLFIFCLQLFYKYYIKDRPELK